MSSITFEHIKKVYDNNVEVVKDFNLKIEERKRNYYRNKTRKYNIA